MNEETAKDLCHSLDMHAFAMEELKNAMQNFSASEFQEAAHTMNNAANRMSEAAGEIAMASRRMT